MLHENITWRMKNTSEAQTEQNLVHVVIYLKVFDRVDYLEASEIDVSNMMGFIGLKLRLTTNHGPLGVYSTIYGSGGSLV